MLNRQRTLEVFGYDLDPTVRRRTNQQVESTHNLKKDLKVVDNCPSCGLERQIQLRASRKNKPCSKCFHATPEMQEAKRRQNKVKSETHKQRMKDSHWSKHGGVSPFKGKEHSEEVKNTLAEKTKQQLSSYTDEEMRTIKIKNSCTQRGIPVDQFDGFSSTESTLIRNSAEGKAWTYDVLAKANFTCDKCGTRGGSLRAHHKNAFNAFPEQRLLVSNGVCLCNACHERFHDKYGRGYNTEDQYEEFKNEI